MKIASSRAQFGPRKSDLPLQLRQSLVASLNNSACWKRHWRVMDHVFIHAETLSRCQAPPLQFILSEHIRGDGDARTCGRSVQPRGSSTLRDRMCCLGWQQSQFHKGTIACLRGATNGSCVDSEFQSPFGESERCSKPTPIHAWRESSNRWYQAPTIDARSLQLFGTRDDCCATPHQR